MFRGYGLVRLKDGKIWTLLTTAAELKGHEEPLGFQRPLGAKHGAGKHRPSWKEEREEEARTLGYTKQPYVVIVGGGQGGIGLGARLRMLGVPTIIVEKNARPGDSWRNRYKSLCLHDPVWYDHMPYLPFPPNWPVFSPKDKIGDWLEMYTKVMELNYWGSTTCKSAQLRRGRRRNGRSSSSATARRSRCRPKHLVLATGMSAKPNMPKFPGMERFKGDQHHSSKHPGPDAYAGKKAVVIGSNNSAHDIAAALWENDADVTMVQRSSTHIVRSDTLMEIGLSRALFRAGGRSRASTTTSADLIFASIPYRILHEFQIPLYQQIKERDAEFYAGLEKAGFWHDWGADGSGLFMKYLRRGSGYYIDVGASQLVIDGKIKLKRGQVEGDHRDGRHARRRDRTAGRPDRLRDRLRLDERLGRRSHQPGGRRQGRQGLGPRLGHAEGPGPVGGRAAQHVEADPAGGAVVPRRQPAPVAPLFAVPGAAAQGADGGHPDAGLRASGDASQKLKRRLAPASLSLADAIVRVHRRLGC